MMTLAFSLVSSWFYHLIVIAWPRVIGLVWCTELIRERGRDPRTCKLVKYCGLESGESLTPVIGFGQT